MGSRRWHKSMAEGDLFHGVTTSLWTLQTTILLDAEPLSPGALPEVLVTIILPDMVSVRYPGSLPHVKTCSYPVFVGHDLYLKNFQPVGIPSTLLGQYFLTGAPQLSGYPDHCLQPLTKETEVVKTINFCLSGTATR